jgi:hypothetical protein
MGHLSAVVIIGLLKMVSAHKKCNAGVVLSGIAGLGKIKKACTRIRTETKIYTDKTPNKKSVLIRSSLSKTFPEFIEGSKDETLHSSLRQIAQGKLAHYERPKKPNSTEVELYNRNKLECIFFLSFLFTCH